MIASVSPDADRELTEAAVFYAREAGTDAALAFVLEYERVLAVLCANPSLDAVWRNGRRRFPLRKFPISVIYYVRDDQVRVIALAHHRRRPGYWGGRE